MPGSIVLKVAMAQRQSEAGFGRARVDSDTRRALGLSLGDTIMIEGKRPVVAKVFKCSIEDEGQGLIRIDGLTRTNAGVSVDENVTVSRCEPQPARKVVLAPNIPEGKRIEFDKEFESVFRNGLIGRPLIAGTDIIVPNIALMGNRSTFAVVSTSPQGPVVVGEDTDITVKDSPQEKSKASPGGKRVTYDDVGGLDDELRRIREIIELPLKHPELFDRLGISAPRGVLLYGPPGTGKTLIAEAVANESGASMYSIRGPEIMGKYYGESEERLRDMFAEAAENAPSIIFLDEIDSIAPQRDAAPGEVERRVVAQLLTLMDGMGDRGNVIVIGATNREDSIDPALRRPGRFDREIEIGVPGRRARLDILSVHAREMPMTEDVSLEQLASITQGFVGADLAALCREAAMKCLGKRMSSLDLDKPVPPQVLEAMKVTMDDFMDALGEIEPSGMREVTVEIPKVTWGDIGGLDSVRSRLDEVIATEDGNEAFDRLGIKPGKGILLYGPPGTGKTLIAKAVANAAGCNFITVNGPEIASKWLGESERAVRQIFKRGKQLSPCIIFFDEIDSIAPIRGSGDSQAWERVVAQILTSIDGVENLKGVTVMAATNRPDMVDPALLRPGRLDTMILVGRPDQASRRAILGIHTRDMPLGGVDLDALAAMTDGYVGADLAMVCREAGLSAYREDPNAREVSMRHFEQAVRSIPPSVDDTAFQFYEKVGREAKKRRTSWDSPQFYGRADNYIPHTGIIPS
ncbi:MAG: AAA family ATPase [Thermoplasmata archaeon]|nr:AAA family ATPase [Thermoplasmata archaeon]